MKKLNKLPRKHKTPCRKAEITPWYMTAATVATVVIGATFLTIGWMLFLNMFPVSGQLALTGIVALLAAMYMKRIK